jgi:pimeloyl-ACP methyl ester carboxylesterase
VPTLLVVGELSDPETRRVSDDLSQILPDATVQALAGQGHGAMISAPQLLASVLRGFYRSLG